MLLNLCVYITLQVNILILISFLENFAIRYRQGTLQAARPEASLPRNPGCAKQALFVFSCIGRLRWNAVCSFLPVSLSGTTLNPDLTSIHRILSTLCWQAFGFGPKHIRRKADSICYWICHFDPTQLLSWILNTQANTLVQNVFSMCDPCSPLQFVMKY